MRKTRKYLTRVSAFFIGVLLSSAVPAQETLYPAGYDIACDYSYEPSDFYQGGRIKVTWIVDNNEDFDLSGIYYTENLPSDLVVEGYSLILDGALIQAYYSGPRENHLMEGYNTYRWVVDFPGGAGHILQPGQTLKLQYKITADNPGDYVFPFHTVCFYGDNTGFFSVADTLFIPPPAQEIPTLGEWGMLIMTLILLTGTTISVIRRSKYSAEATF